MPVSPANSASEISSGIATRICCNFDTVRNCLIAPEGWAASANPRRRCSGSDMLSITFQRYRMASKGFRYFCQEPEDMRVAVFLLFPAILPAADTLLLRSGPPVSGTYEGGDARSIRFVVGDQVRVFPVSDVMSIQFDNPTAKRPSSSEAP